MLASPFSVPIPVTGCISKSSVFFPFYKYHGLAPVVKNFNKRVKRFRRGAASGLLPRLWRRHVIWAGCRLRGASNTGVLLFFFSFFSYSGKTDADNLFQRRNVLSHKWLRNRWGMLSGNIIPFYPQSWTKCFHLYTSSYNSDSEAPLLNIARLHLSSLINTLAYIFGCQATSSTELGWIRKFSIIYIFRPESLNVLVRSLMISSLKQIQQTFNLAAFSGLVGELEQGHSVFVCAGLWRSSKPPR